MTADPAPSRRVLYPLGLRCDVEAETPMLAVVEAACHGLFGAPDPASRRLRLTIAAETPPECAPGIRVRGQRITISGPGYWGEADAGTGRARASIDPLTAIDTLGDQLIEPLLLFLLTRNGRTPLHAATFLIDDCAVLLCGPSGTGKSCLALAAVRAGLPLLTDDMAHVQLAPHLQLWGAARPIHLFAQDAPAGSAHGERLRNGKRKRIVSVSDAGHATVAQRAVLCLLQPGDAVALTPLPIAEARAQARACHAEPGFDLLQSPIGDAIDRLTVHGAFRLTLSHDPDAAIRCLRANAALLRLVAA